MAFRIPFPVRAANAVCVTRARTLIALLSLIVVGGPRSETLMPILRERPAVRVTPVVLDSSDPTRTRVGRLTLLGGWRLDSGSTQFGGWSALHVASDRVTMVGDAGSVLRFRLTPFGRVVDARIDPLPAGCGTEGDKRRRDSESLAGDGADWWVGFEWNNRICRMTGDFVRATGLRAPPQMHNWPRTGGPEAMLRLADGRFLVFAERTRNDDDVRPLLVFSGDPTDSAVRVVERLYRPPEGYAPTDAAQLPDGRILVLNRRFGIPRLFTTALVIVDPAQIDSGSEITGTPVARLSPPMISDNFEGVSVTREHGRTVVWLVSDDNMMSWQATYLLKFALD